MWIESGSAYSLSLFMTSSACNGTWSSARSAPQREDVLHGKSLGKRVTGTQVRHRAQETHSASSVHAVQRHEARAVCAPRSRPYRDSMTVDLPAAGSPTRTCGTPGPAARAARSKPNSESPGERALGWAVGRTVRLVVHRSECARRARQELTEAASEGRCGRGGCVMPSRQGKPSKLY